MRAYGKINLTLAVTGRRRDGYHLLETVMHPVSVYDQVIVGPGDGIRLSADHPELTNDRQNLAWRAAEIFFSRANIKPGAEILLKKNIPLGAGLGGGSADAAAVLRQLNRLFGQPLTQAQMTEAALLLGADVPFFLGEGPALATGVGERLSPAPALPDCLLVICKPPFPVSAGEAYRLFDEHGKDDGRRAGGMLEALRTGNIKNVAQQLFNHLEKPVTERYPQIGHVKEELLRLGALGAAMTGSGSAVFGIFEEKANAKAALSALSGRDAETFLAAPALLPQPGV